MSGLSESERWRIEEWLIDNRWPDAYDLSHAIANSPVLLDILGARTTAVAVVGESQPDASPIPDCEWCTRAELEAFYSGRADGHLEECPTPFRAPSDTQADMDPPNQRHVAPLLLSAILAAVLIVLVVGLGYLWGAS